MTTNQTIDGVPRRKVHHLKIHAGPFGDLVSGEKTGEVRKCDDRDFQVGDSVELFLVDHTGGNATRSLVREITHIQRGYGLPDDLCVLSYAQPQGEPVAWIKPDVAKTLTKDECCCAFGSQNPKGTLIPLYAEQPAPVAVVLAEARTWLGDGLNSDGLAQEYWTPEYAALIERIDATLRNTK